MFLEILLFILVVFVVIHLFILIDLLSFSSYIKKLKKKGLITSNCVLPKNPFKLYQLKKSIFDSKFADEVNFYYFKSSQTLEDEEDVR